MRQIVVIQYKYIFIGESMSVGFGYILPNIGEYMLVELIYWYWIYSANNWEIYITRIFILVLDIFYQQLGDKCQLEGVGLQNML